MRADVDKIIRGIKIACYISITSIQDMTQGIPVPLYYQIVHQLQKLIRENNCAPGERLPSESELQSSFGVSRITARRALEELERSGLATRQRGKGTFVSSRVPTPSLPKFTGSLEDLFMVGRAATVKDATVEQVVAPPGVKAALRLIGPDATVTRVQRVLLLNGRPHTFHQNFYPQSVGENIERQDVLKYPLLELLERKFRIPIIEVHQVVEATVADTEVAERLQVSFGSPLLYVERTLLTKESMPIGFAQAYYRGDSYRLSVTLVRREVRGLKGWRPPATPRRDLTERARPIIRRTK